jgi:hypothetical protein
MGAIGGLLGVSGGANGTGFAAPQAANITNPVTQDQINNSYQGTQTALQQQQALVNALQAQNGIQNQSNVYNQLQGVANGTGPNPAQAQLAQSTGANVANQAALMAGQRGSGANAGLIARQAAQQGANTQQQAAGQAATLQANQSLNALGQLQNVAGQQVSQQQAATGAVTGAQQQQQAALLGAQGQFNSASVANQAGVNQANAGLVSNEMTGQNNLIGNITGAAGSAIMGTPKAGAEGGQVASMPRMMPGSTSKAMYADGTQNGPISSVDYNNQDNVDYSQNQVQATPTPAQNPINTPLPPATPSTSATAPTHLASFFQNFSKNQLNPTSSQSSSLTGTAAAGNAIGKAIGSGLNALFGSSSSSTPSYSPSNSSSNSVPTADQQAAIMGAPGYVDSNGHPNADAMYQMMQAPQGTATQMAKGGIVDGLVSPGEQYLPPKEAKDVAKGKKDPLSVGERIPGKPMYPGNDYRNDIVPKKLEEGGVVIPNKIMQSPNAHWEAMKFVHAAMAKSGKSLPKKAK